MNFSTIMHFYFAVIFAYILFKFQSSWFLLHSLQRKKLIANSKNPLSFTCSLLTALQILKIEIVIIQSNITWIAI